MAKAELSLEILEEFLFGYAPHPVTINDIKLKRTYRGYICEVDIEGVDVPESKAVSIVCTVQQNRAGQKFIIMEFVPIKECVVDDALDWAAP